MRLQLLTIALAIGACRSTPAVEVPDDDVVVRNVEHLGREYRVATVNLRHAELELYGQTEGYGKFDGLDDLSIWLRGEGRELVVGTNAGIFGRTLRPLGLHVERGVERRPLNLADGAGNFFLLPNGVFWIDSSGAHVGPAERAAVDDARLATQSGPLLLIDGHVHPAFNEGSSNLLLRSGVGVSDARTVHLVISEGATRFHDFATLFRDVLGCEDALYLDGVISQMVDAEHPADVDPGRYAGLLVVTRPLPLGDATATWAPPRFPELERNVGPGAPFLDMGGWNADGSVRRRGMEISQEFSDRGTERVAVTWSSADASEVRARLEAAFGPAVPAVPGPGRVVLEQAGESVTVTWFRP